MDTRILVVFSLVASAIAGPITIQEDADKCSTTCIESSKFKYNPGTTYVYDYRVDTDSSLAGSFEDSAKTTLQTTANIEVLSPCEFALQLRNTKLFHSDGKGVLKTADKESELRSEIEGSSLRFSFQNGIVDHICAEKEDSVRSLNLKKGILSAFQNSMDDISQSVNVTETDVSGVCKAEYKVVSNGYYTTDVKKVKNILSCSDRVDYMSVLQLTSYKVPSDMQNHPVMKTSHECDQAIENGGVLKSSVCKESHVYRPFSNGESGARIAVTQTLTYQTYRNGVTLRAGNVKTRSSLLFDHSANQPTQEQARVSVEQKLGQICDTTSFDVRPETPRLFSELAAAMKGLGKQDMTDLHRLLKTKTVCPTNDKTFKYFMDALPMISTDASVSLMASLIDSKDVTGLEATAWLTSLAFIQSPTSGMLLDVKALIDNKDVRMDAMLPVSSLINNFCKKMGTCNQDYAVLSLMSSLERNIDYNCNARGKKFELTLLTLKAIGNAGHAIRAVPVLNKCLMETSNPLEIQVAAAEAFRRMPCAYEDKNLWETFMDKQLDSELRINAYLALIRCPTEENLGKIATILYDEDDEQVGAFVYSHLTNLRETSDPHKLGVAQAINNLALDKEFDMSPLKFSRNFELSALINKINMGVTAESNVIWSNKVQLPRAVSGNLTVELFGQSVNLLDFGGRLEGLEYLIKNIFGPYVKADEKDTKIDTENVKGSVYGRMFGNEMLFMHSQTTQSLFNKKYPSWLDLVIKMAKEQHVAFTKSVQFMDMSMVIPTCAGLPINVQVNGTVTVDLKMNGKMDLRKVGSSPRSMDVDGEIRPSAALEVTGSMYVDSFVTKTGMRMRNTMHTSTAIKGRVQMNRGQQLNVEFDTPEDKMEIFGASSRFFVLHDNMEKEQKMIEENKKEFKSCSSDQMTQITGMEICGELSFPNASMKADSPYFPLTGPSSVSVTLFKRDSLSGYKLFAKRVENKKASMAQITFNTPGSRVNRLISVDMALNYKKQNMEMNMATPWKKYAMNGNMINLKDLKTLSGNLVIDDKDTYAMTGEVKVTQNKAKVQVNPMFELRRPGADNVQVTGFISMEKPFKSVNMEMSLSGVSKLPYTIKTAVTNNKKEKTVEGSISLDGQKEYKVKASNVMSIMGKKSVIAVMKNLFQVETPVRKLVSLTSNADYREDRSLKFDSSIYVYRVLRKPAALKVNLLKTARKKSTNYKGNLNLKSSHISGSVVCNVAKKPSGFMSVTSKVDYSIPRVAKNTVLFSGKFNDRSTKAYKSYIVQSNIGVKKNPEYNSNMKLQIGHKKKLSYVGVDVKYGANPKDKTKRISLLTSLNRKIATLKNAVINYKVKAQAPAHKVNIFLQGKHQHNKKLVDSNVKLTYAPKKDITAGVTLRDRSSKLAKVLGKASVSWPGMQYILQTDLSQKNAKQYSHILNFKNSAGMKHTISTIYKMAKAGAHDVVSNLKFHKMRPISIQGSSNFNPKNFAASGQFKTGKDVYGFKTLSKFSKAPSAKFSLDIIHPSRQISLDVTGGKSKSKYEGKVEAAWDAAKDKTKKLSMDGAFFHKSSKGAVSMSGNVNFQSPFENFENLVGSVKYGGDLSQHSGTGKFMWGNKAKQISSTMSVKKPISLNNFVINGNIKTPFKGLQNVGLDIVHKLDSAMNTVVKGELEKEMAKLSIQGKSLQNGFKGNMNLKSTIKNAENVGLTMTHTGEDGGCKCNAELNHNGKVYAYAMTMAHSGNGWQRQTNGNVLLTLNKEKIATQWNHENTDESMKSAISSKWGNKRLSFDLEGSHKLSNLRNVEGVLKITSPWEPVRDIEVKVDHKHGSGLIDSIAFIRQGKNKKASSTINYKKGVNNADLDFKLASPFHEDLSGKLSTNYDSYPMTTSAELKWAPKMKSTLDGSLNLASWNNADLNMKMTTPSRTLRNVVVKASNKQQNGELVSNLNLDYGMRQNVDIESRIAKNMMRLKVKSPCDHLKSLDTGLSFNGDAYNFDTHADFELLPSLGKFDGAMNWQYGDDMSGKVRVDTPFPEYPYFELSTSSKPKGQARQSHIQAEYYPSQVYSLESTYNFDLPLSVDATIRSPFPEYNDIGLSLQHSMDDSSIKSHGEVKYRSDKKIEGDLNADWASDIEGSLVVKTPFPGYESNKVSMRHRGELKNFDCHGEIDVAEQNVVADASFKSGFTTTGTFTFTSPIPGLELIDASLRKKGNKKSMKGALTINMNGKKIQTTFNNKLTKNSLKAGVNLITPFTQALKLAVDHSGLPESFTNKISVNYGRKVDIDTISSFDLRENDVNGKGILKYKIGSGRNTARVSFSKSGTIEDISFTANTGFNRDDVSVSGSLRTKDVIDGTLQIKTPFNGFKTTGMTLSHSGDMSDFTSRTNINYMDNKNINGKVEFSNMAGNGIKLASEVTTPFKGLESTSLKFNHDMNPSEISGTIELTTSIGDFGTRDISYSKSGDLNDLVLKGSVSNNGKDVANIKLTNNMQNFEVHSKFNAKSVVTPDIYFSLDHSGDSFSFNTQTDAKVGRNMISTDTSMKRSYNSITADSSIVYKLEGQRKNKASISMKKDGSLENCNLELTSKFNSEEAKLTASKSGMLNNLHFSGSASYNKDSVNVNGGWKNLEKEIEGTLKVMTPFDNFNNVGIVLSHNGDLSDFATNFNINYMDNKNINGKAELTAYSIDNIKFMSELMTPFEAMQSLLMKFNNQYDRYNGELNGNAAIDLNLFGSGSIIYHKTGNLNNLGIDGTVLRNGMEIAELKIKNDLQEKELHTSFEYKSTMTPLVALALDHNGDLKNLKTVARVTVGKQNVINGEATLNQRRNTIDANGKVMYNIEGYGSNQASLNVHKEGQMNNFNVELTGKYGTEMSKITGNFKNEDELTGDLTVFTPIDGYKNVGVSFKHSGSLDRFNCEGKMMVKDGEEFSGKIDFYRYLFRRIETVIELNTPITDYEFTKFEYRHEGESDSWKCTSIFQYGNSQRITYDLSATSSPKPQFSVTLKMPQQDLMASGSYDNTWPRYAVNGKVDAGNGNSITLDGSLDASDDIVGAVVLATPFDDFNNVGVSFQHQPKSNGINTEGRITYMDGKVISGKAVAIMSRSVNQASVELTTPFAGYEFTRYESKHVFNKRINKNTLSLVYGDNQRIVIDAYSKFKPTPEMSITISSPFAKDIVVFASFDDSWPKYDLTCKLSPGNGDQFTLDGSFDATKDISGSVKIGTPFDNFNKIGMNFIHSGDAEQFGTEGTVTYMDDQEIFGKVNFYRYMWRRIDASLELTTPFSGMEKSKAEVNFEDNSNTISTTAAIECSGEKMNSNVKITYSPNYEIVLTMNHPYAEYGMKVQGALDLTEPTYEATCTLNYGYDKMYSANGKFNLYSAEHMDGSLEMNTPLSGIEYTKAEYQHKADSNGLDGSVSLTFNNGQKMSCEVKSTLSPNFDGSVTIMTPFRGYEKMQGAAAFERAYNRYETSSSLNLGQGSDFSMTSELDYSMEPMKASTKISTPFKDFRNVQIDITHEGGLTNFKTTGFLSSPITDHINAKASLRYDGAMDMSAAASLQSSLEGFDDLRAEVKTSDVTGEMKSNVVVGWTSGQQITYDGVFHKQEGWNEDKMHADVSISTPFVAVRSMNMQMDHSAQTDSYVEKMSFDLNGDSLLDFDAEYNFNDKKSAELMVRQPWPMQFTASKSQSDGSFDAEVFANWNRDEPNSNVRVQATTTDKSDSYQTENGIDVSVTYASRKVGVVHKLSDKSSQLMSNGYVYWDSDDDSKVSYDLQVNDNSRRNKQIVDGTLKVGLPSRTLGFTGSYSKKAMTVSTDAAFMWDADRDDTKQVGVKATINRGDSLKGDITFSMPAMRKEIRVNGEVMVNNGRVILDTKTDISYSQDSRKTLTLTSKLEDISSRYSHFNYSLALGVKHPFTNVDVQMNSHIGSSDDLMGFHIDTQYLTSKRQMKNLALWTEINKLKKQISVKTFNPMANVEIVGDVVSEKPYKLRLMNKIDNEEAFRSDMTFDSDKKAFSLNAYTDSDVLTLSAKYPNSSALKVDFSRHSPNFEHVEALLAVRLNTSRLMHTRFHWCPQMMQEFSSYAWPKVMENAETALLGITSFNAAVAEELTSKYSAIATEISDEVRPFITALSEELELVADKMNELSIELKKMNMGETVLRLSEKLDRLTQEYRITYSSLISSLRDGLSEMRHVPVGSYYTNFVTSTAAWTVRESLRTMASLQLYVSQVDEALMEYKKSMIDMKQKAYDTIYNATYVDYLANKIGEVQNINISPYISSFNIPKEYTNAIYDIPSKIDTEFLEKFIDSSNSHYVKEGLNEVYQQGVWAYNYWQIEENLEKHAQNILKTLKDIIEDELKEYSEDFNMIKSPITVWDPEHGEIQADFPLPIAIKRLDAVPDFTPLIKKAEKFADTYLPNQGTLDNLVESVSEMWPAKVKNNKTNVEMTKTKPSKKYRKKGRKYKVRRSRQQ